jgi:hypothetical protein
MALATDHLPLGLPGLRLEFCPLALDPPEPADYRQSHRAIADAPRCRHPHPSIRRVDAEVKVLDSLSDNLNPQAVDGNVALFSIRHGF